jgi:hypothetical protein
MKVKYVISVEAPEFGQQLFGETLMASMEAFNRLKKSYNARMIDFEVAPKYTRKDKFNFVMQRELPEYFKDCI